MKSGRVFLGEGAACKDLEVRENVAGSGTIVKLTTMEEASEGRSGTRQGQRGAGGPFL